MAPLERACRSAWRRDRVLRQSGVWEPRASESRCGGGGVCVIRNSTFSFLSCLWSGCLETLTNRPWACWVGSRNAFGLHACEMRWKKSLKKMFCLANIMCLLLLAFVCVCVCTCTCVSPRMDNVIVHVGCLSIKDSKDLVRHQFFTASFTNHYFILCHHLHHHFHHHHRIIIISFYQCHSYFCQTHLNGRGLGPHWNCFDWFINSGF